MADLYSTLGGNARRSAYAYPNTAFTAANPMSLLGTRELAFHKITGLTAVGTNSGNANSIYSRALRALQQVAEVYYAFTPAADVLVVAVAANTNNGLGESNTANDKTIKEALDAEFAGDPLTSTVGAANANVFQTT